MTIEVERVPGEYFTPYIKDHDSGCVFFFHEDDITDEGADAFAEAFTQQAIRWKPRPPSAPRGPQIPIWMELRADLPDDCAVIVDDHPDYIRYLVRCGLIQQRAADEITRVQSERSPDWERTPARYVARLRAL
ncbi:hypothetical protein ACIP3A_03640 [Streptomyces tricolor]|uniref:hypothetical protein n=1 Tax=Streptomyces tricolor TaxID=68277 RepID=UPI00381E2617